MGVGLQRPAATAAAAVVAIGAMMPLAPAGLAHHAAAPHFDSTKTVTLDATITKFELVNPHSYVYFTVPSPDGTPTLWRCELAARTALSRRGWTREVFAPGTNLTVIGASARREANVCQLNGFVTADGREFKRNADFSDGVNPLATLAEANRTTVRPARLPNGQPNLSGAWLHVPGSGGRGNGVGPSRANYVMGGNGGVENTPAGLLAANDYDPIYDKPSIKCEAANIFFALGMNRQVNEITQTDDAVTINYGFMDLVRTVHLNMTAHPANLTPSTAGHSIGRWEGDDTLVVDTVGFAPRPIVPLSSLMGSSEMHSVERFTVDNANGTLTRTYRAEDPYLTAPYTGWDELRVSDEPYEPYNCVELSGANNIRAEQ